MNNVTLDMKLDPEVNWDSIAHLAILSGIDNEYGIIIKGEDLLKCKKIEDLYSLLKYSSIVPSKLYMF